MWLAKTYKLLPIQVARHYNVLRQEFLDSLTDDERLALDLLATAKYFEEMDKAVKKRRRESELLREFGDIEIWDEDDDEVQDYIEQARERDRLDRLKKQQKGEG